MTQQAQPSGNNTPAVNKPTHSERFTAMVMREFSGGTGTLALSTYQKMLIKNYFINIDQTLRKAEEKRLAKSEQYRESTPYTWEHINMDKLALTVVACARIGYDPMLPNHINLIPFKPNQQATKYDITVIEGYAGLELKATKYALEMPNEIIIKLVYSNETFKPIFKDLNNKVESFVHTPAENPFDRGEVIGGYYYYVFFNQPEKNSLVYLNKAQIEKRKPKHGGIEFWGGVKDKWETDKATGKSKKVGTETVEGWYDEMAYKTLARMAYGKIVIDPQKIDDNFISLIQDDDTASIEETKTPVTIDIEAEQVTQAIQQAPSVKQEEPVEYTRPEPQPTILF